MPYSHDPLAVDLAQRKINIAQEINLNTLKIKSFFR